MKIGKVNLHQSNMKYVVIKEPNCLFQENTIMSKIKEFTNVFAVEMSYSNKTQSLIQVQVGQVSTSQSTKVTLNIRPIILTG